MGGLSRHPFIVTVLASVFTSDYRPCIVMDLFERGNYMELLRRDGPLPLEELLSLSVRVAGALATAHQDGVIHGDVKPQNIFKSAFGYPALGDFGIATLRSRLVDSAGLGLSPHYAAPELIEIGAGAVGAAADQYSLGATIYTLAVGRRPFESDQHEAPQQVLARALDAPTPTLPASFPRDLASVLRRAMAREPQDRFPDLTAFAVALANIEHRLGHRPTAIPIASIDDDATITIDQDTLEALRQQTPTPTTDPTPPPDAPTIALTPPPQPPDHPPPNQPPPQPRRRRILLLALLLAAAATTTTLLTTRHQNDTPPNDTTTNATQAASPTPTNATPQPAETPPAPQPRPPAETPAPTPGPPPEPADPAPAPDPAPSPDPAPEPAPDTAAAEPSEPLRVAIVAPSARNDFAFTESLVAAVVELGKGRDLILEITDGTFIVEDAAVAIRDYAADGFDLVIAHGSQYGGSLQEIAPDFPDTSFAWGTALDTFGLPNVFAYTAASDEGGFVLGSMAAALTTSGVLGVVGPIEVGDAKLFVDGFVAGAGAGAQDPRVTVNVVYIDSFSDVARAAETAEAHVSQGADVMTGSAQMVVGAVGVAQREGVAWFGTQADQTELAPEVVVASQVYEWEVVLTQIADAIDRGVKGGEAFTITLANGGLSIAYNDAYGLPASVRQIGEDTVAGIIDGSIDTMGAMAGPASDGIDTPLRVAIVAPSASNDLAFTQSIVEGVAALGATRELEVEVTDGTFIVEDAAVAIRDYAADGFDLVIAHGSQYGGSLQEIAPDFPDTSFAWGTALDTFGLPNVFAYTAASDEGGFVLGSMAAALTESGVLGVVGPIEVGDAKLFVDGFVAGAGAQDPRVTVNVVYIDSFSDVAKAAETAEAHVSQGADVMTGSAQMVVGAVSVAQREGVAWFGTQADQTELAPEVVVASQVYEWEVVLSQIADAIDRGVKGGEAFTITLANGGLSIAYNDAYGLPASVRQIGENTVAGIINGSIDTGS